MVHRYHIFCLYKQKKSAKSKEKFREANNCCKRVLEAVKLTYADETKHSIASQELGSRNF